MSKNNIIQIDEEIDRLYHQEMKPMLDDLHGRFINESLAGKVFEENSLKEYFDLVDQYKKNSLKKEKDKKLLKTLKENIDEKASSLRKILVNTFEKAGELWKVKYLNEGIKLKDKGYKILTEASILEVLLKEFPDKKEILEKFKGFWTYFGGYNQNRENYYSNEAKATSVANRTVTENLARYIDNIIAFRQVVEKIPELKIYEHQLGINFYNNYLNQEGIDQYNRIIGGVVDENDKKIQGINEKINLFCQQNKLKLPKLKLLYKQIGSDKKGLEIFMINDGEEWSKLHQMLDLQRKDVNYNGKKVQLFESLKQMHKDFFVEAKNSSDVLVYDLDKIYFNKISLNTISSNWFITWKTLADLLKIKEDKKTGEQKIPPQISLAEIKETLVNLTEESHGLESIFKTSDALGQNRKKYFENNAWITFLNIWESEIDSNFSRLYELEKDFRKESSQEFKKNDKVQTAYIKDACDSMLAIERMAKYHIPKDTNLPQDEDFYWIVDLISHERSIFQYYNAFRNHLSKKPYNQNKIKLNFECGSLLGGWAQDYSSYAALIFKKSDKYFLGIIKGTKFFREEVKTLYEDISEENKAQRFVYEMQKPDNKNTPRLFIRSKGDNYAPMVKELNLPVDEIIDLYDRKLFQVNKKSPGMHKPHMAKLIDYFKIGFTKHPAYKNFKFVWRESSEYENIAQFYEDVMDSCYLTNWENINFSSLEKLAGNGKIYLFEIHNKDFNGSAYGHKNLHTLIFLELLKPENAKKIKLLGGGEIFYRKKSEALDQKKIKTTSGKIIQKNGTDIDHLKRYLEDKYFLHFPIELIGRSAENLNKKINQKIQTHFNDFNIIGIDRGEKHLIYYSVINSRGEILKQGSLNTIKIGDKEVDFNEKLTVRANEMMKARKNWQQIGNIKNFKEGYLSQVIHEIYRLMLENNAILVLEDLNSEFKAKRTAKVEKSVYKKFELALARKLNHLILKDRSPGQIGGVLAGYQLAPLIGAGEVSRFEKAKQWGVMFYVRANYTSVTDPVSGWRKHLYILNSANINAIKDFFKPSNKDTGIQIFYSDTFQSWGFKYQQKETDKEWELIATPEIQRFSYDPKTRGNKSVDLHAKFEILFKDVQDKSGDIYTQICNIPDFNWKTLAYLWNLLNQVRNTDRKAEGNENDFIQSPVYSPKINGFYDSRKKYDFALPENGDANGAYNTARKGLMLMKRIQENPEKYEQIIKDAEWDKFVIMDNPS